jgi:hypothetical protein
LELIGAPASSSCASTVVNGGDLIYFVYSGLVSTVQNCSGLFRTGHTYPRIIFNNALAHRELRRRLAGMSDRAPDERRPITPDRAAELVSYGAHFAWTLVKDPDPLTLSELLVVIGTAAGVALGSVEDPKDRKRLLEHLSRLAMKTAEDARHTEFDAEEWREFKDPRC